MALVDKLTDKDINSILERFDQTDPALQRKIVCEFICIKKQLKVALLELVDIGSHLGPCLWSEDDSGCHDRERLHVAFPRVTGLSRTDVDFVSVDKGDCIWEFYKDFIVCNSYPGNTAIYRRKHG